MPHSSALSGEKSPRQPMHGFKGYAVLVAMCFHLVYFLPDISISCIISMPLHRKNLWEIKKGNRTGRA